MTHKVDRHTVLDGEPLAATLRAVLQFQGRQAAADTALTDSSGGTPGALAKADAAATNEADAGTTLAGKASTETALGTVKDALATLFAKANTAAGTLGLETVTYSGGGASGGDTLGAVTVTVTGAATGAQATEWNAIVADMNNAFYVLAAHVNRLCTATGSAAVDASAMTDQTHALSVAAISTDVGTAADPGVTKAAADAALAAFANNAASVATAINAVIDGAGSLDAVAV
jgi:hypothetical protein